MRSNVNGRRKRALEYLEAQLKAWNSHNNDYSNHKGTKRSHDAEKARLEKEIAILKERIK